MGDTAEQTLRDAGVGIVHDDLKDPPSLEPLCRDALAIVSTANSVLSRRAGDTFAAVDRDGHLSLIAAGRRSGGTSRRCARILGAADVPRSYVSLHDVASVAAALDPRAANRDLRVTHPEPLSASNAVQIVERILGRSVRVQHVQKFALRCLALILTPVSEVGASLLAMASAAGETAGMKPLQQEFGLRLTPFEEYVRNVVRNRDARVQPADA